MRLHSAQLEQNQFRFPLRYTAQGESLSPPLEWSDVPPGTSELALLVEDPDAPFPQPFVHWMVYAIRPETRSLSEAASSATTSAMGSGDELTEGKNSLQAVGYSPPNPPFFHRAHRYVFRLFALSEPLALAPGAGREEFRAAMEGKVIAQAQLTARYGKAPVDRLRAVALWAGIAAGVGAMLWFAKRQTASRA